MLGYAYVDRGVDAVSAHLDAAATTTKGELHRVTAEATHELASQAHAEMTTALHKLDRCIDDAANGLTSAAMREIDSTLEAITSASAALWGDAITATLEAVRAQVRDLAARRREASIASLPVRVSTERELGISKARASAAREARQTFDHEIQRAREARTDCIASGAAHPDDAGSTTPEVVEHCEQQYQSAVLSSKAEATSAVDAAAQSFETAFDANHMLEQLENEITAEVRKWESEQIATLELRADELRKQGRERVDLVLAAVRSEMQKTSDRLRQQVHDRLKLPDASAYTLSDETQIASLVNGALDTFIANMGEHVQTMLRKEARRGVDLFVDGIKL